MSTQQKASGGGRKTKTLLGAGSQKDASGLVVSEQNNNQTPMTSKKHNIVNVKDTVNNNNTADQTKPEKEKSHVKPTAEQIRIAQITEIKSGVQDPTREKVSQLMEMTERSEEDACYALYECDNDVERAVIYLLENLEVGALITTTKKKKNKPAAADGAGDAEDFEASNQRDGQTRDGGNDRSRNSRGSNRGRTEGGFNRGRSRPSGESRDDRAIERPARGMGPRRGGFSGTRGGRGGRMGPRGGQSSYRDQNHRNNYRNNNQDQQEIDNWDPASTQVASENKNDETWGDCGDWDNEEYTGSLSDTKVFTPSGAIQSTNADLAAPPGLEQQILNPPTQNDVTQYSATVVSSTATAAALNGQYGGEIHSATTAAAQLRQALEMPLGQSASLSAEQSQYFNTLGSQNSTAYSSSVQYPYNDQVVNQQAPRQQQQQRPRARVPPPSKIPSSAVEMPGDGLNVYLGVQFGELDFGTGTDESYETEKYASGMDPSTGDDYATNKVSGVSKGSQSTGLGGLQQSLIQNSDSISSSAQGDISSGYTQRNPNTASMVSAGGQSALDQLTKPADIYNHGTGTAPGGNTYQNLSYSTTQKSGSYQTSYGTNYNNTASSNNYPPSSNTYGYQNSYQQQSQGTQSGGQQQQTQTTGSSVSSGAANQPANSSSGYMSNQYPVNQSGFPSQQNAYQNQNVYGNAAGLNSSDRYSGSINSLTSKLKGTPGAFESSNNAVSSVSASVSSNVVITTSSINTPSLGLSSTKSTAPTKSGSSQVTSGSTGAGATTNATGVGASSTGSGNGANNVVQNIPLVSSYIQPAFYQQQPYLHFEDMQLVQPRMTPMTGYYEYQPPTSLGAGVRNDGTAASNLASVAYPTMAADGRFTRTDNNSSPVQSQQTGTSQQLMNLPPYAYFYGTNVMPSGFQQFPTQIYSQMPATNPNAGQFAKQSAYNSAYGSAGYDALNQTAPDYNKTAYQSAGQQAKGHSATNQTGTNSDIASSMYNKNHVTLNKVNSYDKQSFHSGTPPPFNLAGSQAGSQTQAYQQHLYLQPMAPHHNINMHQPIHQMDGARLTGSRRDTNSSGQRQQSSNQSKGSKPTYQSPSYWNTQN